jgi:hypothetical protein
MRKVISFSASVRTDKGIIGNCFVSYLYCKMYNQQSEICYVDSILYVLNDSRYMNREFWNDGLSAYWTSIIEGKRLVADTLKTLYKDTESFYFDVKDEKYVIEKNQKQVYILKDNVNNAQIIQLIDPVNYINQETRESITMSFQEIEDKYLNN